MKALKFLLLIILFSCKSYMEYTAGCKEIDYSFDNASVRRFHDLETALKHPERVIFLDISAARVKDPHSVFYELNETITKFTHLKKLTLEGNDTLPIPGNIFKMQKLEFLALTSFKDTSKLSQLNWLQNLRFLSLDFCGLDHLPSSVLLLKNLQGLDLTGNEISYLPEEFSVFRELITIDLTNNLFTEVPSVLRQNQKLKYIDLNNAEGTEREKLSVYRVGVNDIKRMPDLWEFKSLREIYITHAYPGVDSLQRQYAHVKVR